MPVVGATTTGSRERVCEFLSRCNERAVVFRPEGNTCSGNVTQTLPEHAPIDMCGHQEYGKEGIVSPSATCIRCGAPLSRPGAKFCTRCGKPQETATLVEATSAMGASSPDSTSQKTQIVTSQGSASAQPAYATGGQNVLQRGASHLGPLLIVQDVGRTFEVALGQQPLSIGRAPDNDIVIPSRFVSGCHVRIEPHGVALQITAIGSTNGLLFEGRRILVSTPHSLADSDVLRIGDPATGNFVTLTYHNPQVPKVQQAVAGRHRYRLVPTNPQITIDRGEGRDFAIRRCRASMRSLTASTGNMCSAMLAAPTASSCHSAAAQVARILGPTRLVASLTPNGPVRSRFTLVFAAVWSLRARERLHAHALHRSAKVCS